MRCHLSMAVIIPIFRSTVEAFRPLMGGAGGQYALRTPPWRGHEPRSAALPELPRWASLAAVAALPLAVRRAADPARRAQQLQGLPGVPRALQEGHGAARCRDQCGRRRARAAARDRVARRQRQPRRCGARGRGTSHARKGRHADGDIRVQRRARRGRSREAAQGALPRRRAAHRQDRLGERQPVHVPAARVDLHADGDARARGGEARRRSAGRSSIPITSTGSRPPPRSSSR